MAFSYERCSFVSAKAPTYAKMYIILYRTFIFQIQLTTIQSMLERKRIGFLRKSCEIARKEIKGQIIFEAKGNRVNSNSCR